MSHLYPEPPFNMLISGITGCGKTHYVLDLLQNEFKGKFDYIVIICSTFPYNTTYDRRFIYEDYEIFPIAINDDLDKVLNTVVNIFKDTRKQEQTLVLVDDCANLRDAKHKSTWLTNLAFHGRHVNLSCWFITQKYNAIVKDFRENIKILVIFYDKDKKSRESAFDENDTGMN